MLRETVISAKCVEYIFQLIDFSKLVADWWAIWQWAKFLISNWFLIGKLNKGVSAKEPIIKMLKCSFECSESNWILKETAFNPCSWHWYRQKNVKNKGCLQYWEKKKCQIMTCKTHEALPNCYLRMWRFGMLIFLNVWI